MRGDRYWAAGLVERHAISKLLLSLLLLFTACASAPAAQLLKVDVTYTDGQIISGPLTPDLPMLPASVDATFLLNGSGAGNYSIEEVLQSSLVFGDSAWNAGHLQGFSATLIPGRGGFLVSALFYQYAPLDTATSDGKIAGNFPLDIEGTDIASGQAFHYRYDTSNQTVTLVPEPSGIAAALAAVFVSALPLGRSRRKCFRLRLELGAWSPPQQLSRES